MAETVSRRNAPVAWCAECDGTIYDYDIHIQLGGVSYCAVCGPDQAAKAAEECHLEEARDRECSF